MGGQRKVGSSEVQWGAPARRKQVRWWGAGGSEGAVLGSHEGTLKTNVRTITSAKLHNESQSVVRRLCLLQCIDVCAEGTKAMRVNP